MVHKNTTSKTRKFQEASSSGPKIAYDSKKFISQTAWERCNEFLVREIIPNREQGFEADYAGHEGFKNQIEVMQWNSFADHPDQGYLDLVREFYANFWAAKRLEPHNCSEVCKVTVRGKIIDISPDLLQKFLGIEGIERKDCPIKKLGGKVDLNVLSRTICTSANLIFPLGKGDFTTTKTFLKPEARVWMYFINTRIYPSTNFSRITRDRILMLYCIMTGQKVHLGSILFNELHEATRRNQLWFPALINKLCSAAKVPIKKGEEKNMKANAIKNVRVRTFLAGGEVDDEDLGTDSRPIAQRRFSRSLNERLDRIEAKQESLAKMIVHLGQQTFKGLRAIFEANRSGTALGPEKYEEPDITWFRRKGKEPVEEGNKDVGDDETVFLDEEVRLDG